MSLHDFLVLWGWLSTQHCVAKDSGGNVFFGGSCTQAILYAIRAHGTWLFQNGFPTPLG